MQGNEIFAPGAPQGFKFPENAPKDWFTYPISFTSVVDAVPQTAQLNIDAGSDFYWTALTAFASVDGTTTAIDESTNILPKVSMILTDTGSNRQLMQGLTPIPLIAGTGRQPGFLIYPRRFQRLSNVQVQIVSYDATNTYDFLFLGFVGFKIFS